MIHRNWFVELKPGNAFREIFTNGLVPIRDAEAETRICGGIRTRGRGELTYMLAWYRCSIDQQKQIAAVSAGLHGLSEKEVFKEIETRGMPIRVSQTLGAPRGAA